MFCSSNPSDGSLIQLVTNAAFLYTQIGKVQEVTDQRILPILRLLLLICNLQKLRVLAILLEPLAHARLELTPVDAKDS